MSAAGNALRLIFLIRDRSSVLHVHRSVVDRLFSTEGEGLRFHRQPSLNSKGRGFLAVAQRQDPHDDDQEVAGQYVNRGAAPFALRCPSHWPVGT